MKESHGILCRTRRASSKRNYQAGHVHKISLNLIDVWCYGVTGWHFWTKIEQLGSKQIAASLIKPLGCIPGPALSHPWMVNLGESASWWPCSQKRTQCSEEKPKDCHSQLSQIALVTDEQCFSNVDLLQSSSHSHVSLITIGKHFVSIGRLVILSSGTSAIQDLNLDGVNLHVLFFIHRGGAFKIQINLSHSWNKVSYEGVQFAFHHYLLLAASSKTA